MFARPPRRLLLLQMFVATLLTGYLNVGAAQAVAEDICLPPGHLLLTDPEGDILSPAPSQGNTSFFDLRSLSVSQPYFENGDFKLLFQLKVTSLSSVPPGTIWQINLCSPAFPCTDTNAAVSATNKPVRVQMSTAGGATPVFQVLMPNNADATRATVVAEPESNFNRDGTISISVKGATLGLTPEGRGTEIINKFLVRMNAVALAPDNMPNTLIGEGEFTTATAAFCAPNLPPVARLAASTLTGTAPLNVNFDGSGSSDDNAGDTIASYSFDFGDGSAPVTQATPTIAHTYSAAGSFTAKLSVEDSRGMASASDAEQLIVVSAASGSGPPPPATPPPSSPVGPTPSTASSDTGRFGGGAFSLMLLPLLLLARRRRR